LVLFVVAGVATAQTTVSASGEFFAVSGVTARDGAILRIVGPGGLGLMMKIPRGEATTINLMDAARALDKEAINLQPGVYRYEVVSRPGGEIVRGRFSLGTAAGDGANTEEDIGILGTNNLDWVSISDDDDDGITTLDLDSDGGTFDLHWTLVNENGFLFFQEHDTAGVNSGGTGLTNVSFMRNNIGGGVGIGTEVTLFSLDIQAASPIINLADTDGGSNWKLINAGGDFWVQSDCHSACSPNERWEVVRVVDGSGEDSLVIDPTGTSLSSSRTVKKNIERAATATLLEQVAELPIYTWSYSVDSTDTMHVGPMAEDFHHQFGLGADEKRISPIDTSGVALAAVQALYQELGDRETEIAELKASLEAQRAVDAAASAEIAALKAAVEELFAERVE